MNSTLVLILQELALFARNPLMAGLAPSIGEVLATLTGLVEAGEASEAERQELLARVKQWNTENRGPSTDELTELAAARDRAHARAQELLAGIDREKKLAEGWIPDPANPDNLIPPTSSRD